jgi:hypothetical protein
MRDRFTLAFALLLALGLETALAQDENPTGNTEALKEKIETGCGYTPHSGNGSRSVTDLKMPGALGVYGLDFTRYWNSIPNFHDSEWAVYPTEFGFSGWSHSWKWHAVYAEECAVQTDPNDEVGEELYKMSITITFPDGHALKKNIIRANHPIPPWGGAPADPRCGPPYTQSEINAGWAGGASGDHNYMGNMAPDGSNFWLYTDDGGAVHFVGNTWDYRATEVFDRYGFRTDLSYDETGRLTRVQQEGGERWLTITWKDVMSKDANSQFYVVGRVIESVETGGSAASQKVTYQYKLPYPYAPYVTLASVTYPDDPAPGQTSSAI